MMRYKVLFTNKDSIYVQLYDENDKCLKDYKYERFSLIEYECWKVQEDRKEIKNNKCKRKN